MTITREDFNKIDSRTGYERGNAVLLFLERNKEQAFTRKEISEIVKGSKTSLSQILTRLKKIGYIEHKSIYWIYKKHKKSPNLA